MSALSVYYEHHYVGELARDDDLVFSFVYADEWLSNPVRFPLSLAMPLTSQKFGNRITLSFFENLLPEGEVMESLQRSHGISGVFDFLENYGQDCAGAVIVTDQTNYHYRADPTQVIEVDMSKVYLAIEERSSVADVIANMNPGYLSLAGAQDKFAAIYEGGSFFIPTHGAPTTHIVKTPIQHSGIKESVLNEYFCMQLAREVGFQIPECFVIDGRHPLFIVTRYDRFQDNTGIVHRIHQQDFCQAHGRTSEFKYEEKGGPTIKDNYNLLASNVPASKRLESIQTFLDWICFNLIIGNHDSHSKNISFLLRNGKNELAPFYDLICTAIYPNLRKQFAFQIGDRYEFSRIGRNQIKLLENSLALREGTFRQRLATVNTRIHEKKDTLVEKICNEFPSSKIPYRISQLIDDRTKSLKFQGAID